MFMKINEMNEDVKVCSCKWMKMLRYIQQMNEDVKVCSCKWIKWMKMLRYIHANEWR